MCAQILSRGELGLVPVVPRRGIGVRRVRVRVRALVRVLVHSELCVPVPSELPIGRNCWAISDVASGGGCATVDGAEVEISCA